MKFSVQNVKKVDIDIVGMDFSVDLPIISSLHLHEKKKRQNSC